MRRPFAFILHAIAASVMAWGWFNFLDQTLAKRIMTQKGGLFQFLTNQGLFLAWSCMIVSLFCDVLPSVPAVVLHLKKTLLLISMPLEFVISGIYWPLLLFSPSLITPSSAVSRLPLVLDLALHASPVLTLMVDFFFFEPRFSKTYVHWVAPAALVLITVPYASFVEYCALFNGFFPYPFLTQSSFAVRVLIYAAVGGVALGAFRMLNALHD